MISNIYSIIVDEYTICDSLIEFWFPLKGCRASKLCILSRGWRASKGCRASEAQWKQDLNPQSPTSWAE